MARPPLKTPLVFALRRILASLLILETHGIILDDTSVQPLLATSRSFLTQVIALFAQYLPVSATTLLRHHAGNRAPRGAGALKITRLTV